MNILISEVIGSGKLDKYSNLTIIGFMIEIFNSNLEIKNRVGAALIRILIKYFYHAALTLFGEMAC